MVNPAIFDKPFFEVTIPLVITIASSVWLAVWNNNKRLDDIVKRFDEVHRRFEEVNRRFDKVDTRLDKIDDTLRDFGTRIVQVETRAWK